MFNIFKLGFVDFGTKDVEAMSSYYSDYMGLTLTEKGEDNSAYFSSAVDHHNIILTPQDRAGIRRIGFQYQSEFSAEDVAEYLRGFNIDPEVKTDADPGVPKIIEFTDPEGYVINLYQEMAFAKPGFKKTGIVPNKVGHISIRVSDPKKQVEFYKQLGLYNTDWIEDFFGFMTCNRDHHVLNFCKSSAKGLHHIAFELRDYSHMIGAIDFLRYKNKHMEWGPSRHGAGHNIACYHYDADNNLIELFTDADVFIKELDMFGPRPWHKDFPQKPKVWNTDECISLWGVEFQKTLV